MKNLLLLALLIVPMVCFAQKNEANKLIESGIQKVFDDKFDGLSAFSGGLLTSTVCELLNVFQEVLNVAGDDLGFIKKLGPIDDDFVDHDVVAKDGEGLHVYMNFRKRHSIVVAPSLGIADGKPFERARTSEWRDEGAL